MARPCAWCAEGVPPEEVVLASSTEARTLAAPLDAQQASRKPRRVTYRHECASCKEKLWLRESPTCGHSACTACWARSVNSQSETARGEQQLCFRCCVEGCGCELDLTFLREELHSCLLCGQYQSERSLFTNESWAGTWHAACEHAACLPCLHKHIDGQLAKCDKQRFLRVPCYAPGCHKVIPQTLVFEASDAAKKLAENLDEQHNTTKPWRFTFQLECPLCKTFGWLREDIQCGHVACETCWTKWAGSQLATMPVQKQLRLRCCHEGCECEVDAEFLRKELPPSFVTESCAWLADEADKTLRRLGTRAWRNSASTQPGPVCSVCREHQVALLHDPAGAGATCAGHAACERCWATWAEGQLDRCLSERSIAVRCLAPGCGCMISEGLWLYLAARSGQLAHMQQRLARRRRLQANILFPEAVQVECPRRECMGLGYLGFDTVMCFMCEYQWLPEDGAGGAPAEVDVEQIMGLQVKRCPKCQEYIEKNGGCDHMTCRCTYQFFWSTMRGYRGGA
mmetsp:Transcript_133676/g.427414  ORF Transcript_133676/g.427414 Transcript_133676/m.427414 type:complete len:512 (-) Transcript_133676:74-1609(-)